MSTINVTPLSNRVTIPYGIKIEKENVEVLVTFKAESELIKIKGAQIIKGKNFEISPGPNTQLQWKGKECTFEELWDKIFEAWDDYQECMAFPNLVLGGCAGWVPTP